jgi:hypothetical protein
MSVRNSVIISCSKDNVRRMRTGSPSTRSWHDTVRSFVSCVFFPPSSRSSVVPHQTSKMPDPIFCSFCLCCFFPCFSTFFSDACHAFQVCTRKSRSRLTALSVTKIHIRTRQATARARAAVRASTRIEKEAPRAFHAVREATELGAILAPQVFIEGKRTGKI